LIFNPKTVDASSFGTLEALVDSVAAATAELVEPDCVIFLRVEKPSAVTLAEAAGVEIVRRAQDLAQER
jgi:dihydroneopterin aldolase